MLGFQNLAKWYFSKRTLPYWGVILIDSLIVFGAGLIVFALTKGTTATLRHWPIVTIEMLGYLLCYLVGFRIMHTYSGIIRYSSFVDLQRVGMACAIGLGLSFPMKWLMEYVSWYAVLGYVDLVVVFLLATLMMWLIRVQVKFVYDMGFNSSRAKRVFVYGTKQGGVSLAKSIRN